MKDMQLCRAMNQADEKYILETMPQKSGYYDRSKQRKISRRLSVSIVASIVLALLMLNIVNPVYARELPILGGIFAYIQDRLDFPGAYSNYADDVGIRVEDHGVSITVSEVYCDGTNLFVSYKIESEKKFESYTEKAYSKNQIELSLAECIETSKGRENLDSFGVAGLEGEFTDPYTFIGAETYSRKGEKFPEAFKLRLDINVVQFVVKDMQNTDAIRGVWKFDIPVSVNSDDITTLDVNVTEESHSIDKVVVSPVMLTIYTSYPDIYDKTVNYGVAVYGDKTEEDIVLMGQYAATNGITQIPRKRTDKLLDIYVFDNSKIVIDSEKMKENVEKEIRKQIEENAIVHKQIILP